LSGYKYLGDGGTDRREILHDGIGLRQIFSPFLGGAVPSGIPQIRNFEPKFWPFDREYLENGKSQHYMLTSAQQELSKTVSHGTVPPGCAPLSRMAGLCLADALFSR